MLGPAVILVMLGVFLVIGSIAARKVRGGTHQDLIVAGRQMPLLLALLTMTATWVGTSPPVFVEKSRVENKYIVACTAVCPTSKEE